MPSPFSGLDTVIIRVRDIAATTQWYVQSLGAEAIYEDEEQRLSVVEFGGDPDAEVAGNRRARSAKFRVFRFGTETRAGG